MINIIKFVGSKLFQTVAVALAVGLILFSTIQYIQRVERDKVTDILQIEQLENEVEIRREVNDILQENRQVNPSRDGSIALEQLRQRYRSTDSD